MMQVDNRAIGMDTRSMFKPLRRIPLMAIIMLTSVMAVLGFLLGK